MRVPDDSQLLQAFEEGGGRHPVRRALALLQAALPEQSPDDLARLPVGRRDALLLRLRALVFGASLQALADCPACGGTVELELAVAELLAAGLGGDAAGAPEARPGGPPDGLAVEVDGLRVSYRLPTSEDLLAVAAVAAGPDAAARLLERCLLGVGGGPSGQALPAAAVEAVEAGMAAADPLAEIELELSCPTCGHGWAVTLDVATFVWLELAAWVERTLSDVHLLASHYGWSEQAILGLSGWRRGAYLERIGG